MRELEHFARISGGEVKVAGGKEKGVEIEAKSVRVIAKDLEETGHVTEGLLKKVRKVKGGSTHSVLKEEEEAIIEASGEKEAEEETINDREVEIEMGLDEGITDSMGVYDEESSPPKQIRFEELDTFSFKDISLNEPTQKVDVKSESKIGKPGSPETNKAEKSLPGPSKKKDLELKNIKTKNHTPERSKIARSPSMLTTKKPLKSSTPTKTKDTIAAAAKGKERGSRP